MWSCRALPMRIRLRMYCAFAGISSWRASSTARTDAIAWTVVQTPQKRCANTQPSRGSRPRRIVSIPRHMVQLAQAFCTVPPSTSTSIRRWPSMRVTGSMVIRLVMVSSSFDLNGLGAGLAEVPGHIIPLFDFSRQHGKVLDGEAEGHDSQCDVPGGDEQLRYRREVKVVSERAESNGGGDVTVE